MPSVNNLTFSYQEYKSYVKNNKESRLANRSYSMESGSGQAEERLLGSIVYKDFRTGSDWKMEAVYADDFTSDTPFIKVTASGADQKRQEYRINIDEIDVNAASDMEMFALCSYLDTHEKGTGGAAGSWNSLRAYVNDKRSGINDPEQKRDWFTMVGEEKESCVEAGLYQQVADGNRLTHMLEKYGMPKEVEMMRIGENTLVPVDNGILVRDVDGGYAQILFDNSGEIRYENHLNEKAGWQMEVSKEMLKKAQELGSGFAMFMSDRTFWENYLNGDMDASALKAAMDYKAIRSDFYEALPEPVRQAWNKVAEEIGIDGLGVGGNGETLYPSEFMSRYMSAVLKGGNTGICGDTAESMLEFARTALSRLEDKNQPKYNATVQSFKDKEVLFYQKLIEHLGNVGL